jgi:hypothetical protein
MIKKLYHEIQIPKFKKPDSLLEAQACLIRLAHRILSWFSRFNFNPDNEKHIILWFDIFTGYMVETTRTFERESCCTRFANCLLVTSALTALFILVEIILLSRYQPITFPR